MYESDRDLPYDPQTYKDAYDEMEHGKIRMSGIRSAIEAADAHQDTSYRIYFRLELCRESVFYGDGLDMMVIFPQALAIIDQYPDTEATVHELGYSNSLDHILWVYKWMLEECADFYQVPLEDCLKFFEDFKKRSLAYGYNLRPYYYYKYFFYSDIGKQLSTEAFHKFGELPRDGNCDCEACEQNSIVNFYLKNGDPERAARLAEDIEHFRLTCGHGDKGAWLRLKKQYMKYHMERGEYEEAETYCRMMERHMTKDKEYQRWEDFLWCYANTNMGKALQIYKAHWKEWEQERNPSEIFDVNKNIACFFKKLAKEQTKKTIRLPLDASFPLYDEQGCYLLEDLFQYYYNRARDVARRFDQRNGTSSYCDRLAAALKSGGDLDV